MCQRGKHYYSDFYAGGRRVRKKLATDFDAACDILIELRSRAQKADFGLLDNDYPLAKLKDQYLRHCEQSVRPKTVRRRRRMLDKMLGRLGADRASQLTVDAVLLYRQGRLAEGVVPSTVNLEVTTFGGMLRWACGAPKLIGSNPLDGVKPLPHDRPKEGRPLTDDEVRRLLDASPPRWRDVWYAFLVTGMRKGEVAALLFTDVDWEARELIVRSYRAKGKRERRIPIDDGLWDILRRQQAGAAARRPGKGKRPQDTERILARFSREHVFVNSVNTPLTHNSTLYEVFMGCCRRAGIETHTYDREGGLIEHVDLHSLRRTFATSLIVGGADPKSVQELLGHKTLEMTMKIYAKVHGQSKRQALSRLPYGKGAGSPGHVIPVQFGHQSVTTSEKTPALPS
jgi:integrase